MPRSRSRRRRKTSSFDPTPILVLIAAPVVWAIVYYALVTLFSSPWFLPILAAGLCVVVAGWFWLRIRRKRLVEMQEYNEQQSRLMFAQSIGNLLALTPREFELTIGSLLQAHGYRQVRHTGASGDMAADLHAISPQGEYVVVQCKRYAPGQRIGSPDIQRFLGMVIVHHGAQRGIFVTTSSFTTPAQALAHQHNVELIDGQQLTAMFAQVNGASGYP